MNQDWQKFILPPASHVPYFALRQPKPAGTAIKNKEQESSIPEVFLPLSIKNVTISNRIGVSPMCTYSAKDGLLNQFHTSHYSYFAMRGAGVVIVESTAITPEGRISPRCLGIWSNEQAIAFKDMVDFIHSQDKVIGIQLCHSGSSGSTAPLYYGVFGVYVPNEHEGWLDKLYSSSAGSLNDEDIAVRGIKALTVSQIYQLIEEFGDAAKRAVEQSGFDFVEIHAAHGFLISQFLSNSVNNRTDEYGGFFENRTRFLFEIIENIKSKIPASTPLWIRISASENNDDDPKAWRMADTERLVPLLVKSGIDVIDVSSGGNSKVRSGVRLKQTDMAKTVKSIVKDTCLVAAVGSIDNAEFANDLLKKGHCDICLVGKTMLTDPCLPENWAKKLKVKTQKTIQWGWPFEPVFE